MRKNKIFTVDVQDYRGIKVGENDDFYSNDTDAFLTFTVPDESFEFDNALLYLINIDDGSVVTEIETEILGQSNVEYEITPEIMAHYGRWKGQIVFQKDGEKASSAIFEFVINRFLTDERPPTLNEVESIAKLRQEAKELIEELSDTYDDLLENGVLQTNINNKLTELETQYSPKLTEVSAQLAQKANKSEANSLQSQINHLVVDSGESNAEVAQARVDSKGNIFPTVKGHLDNIENVMRQRLSEISSAWEQGTIQTIGDVSSDTRIRTSHFFITEQFSKEVMVEVTEGYQFNIVCYDENKVRVMETGWKQNSQINGIDYPFFRVVLSKVDNSNIMVEDASNVKIYEKVEFILDEEITSKKIAEKTITPSQTTFVHGDGKYNLFDGEYIRLFIEQGVVHRDPVYSNIGKGFVMEVTGGSKYFIRKEESNRFVLGFHKSVVDLTDAISVETGIRLDYLIGEPPEGGVVAPNDAKYMVVYVSNEGSEPKLQVTEGKDYPFFLGYGVQINLSEKSIKTNSLVDGEALMGLVELDKKELKTYHFLGEMDNIYKSAEELLTVDLMSYIKLISAYDGLVTAFPNYVTKKSIGTDDFGNTMYEYFFKAPSIVNKTAFSPRRLKILITTGVHGQEHQTTLAVFRFFHELCHNPRGLEGLDSLRWNVDFKVIPSVTPSAYTITRHNANEVNINRNFPTGWRIDGDDSDLEFGAGTEPLSEPESRNVDAWYKENLDAYYYIDYHAHPFDQARFYVDGDTSATIAQSTLRVYEKRWRELNDLPETYSLDADIVNQGGGMTVTYATTLGINSLLPECPWFGYAHQPMVQQRIVLELFANTIFSIVKKK